MRYETWLTLSDGRCVKAFEGLTLSEAQEAGHRFDMMGFWLTKKEDRLHEFIPPSRIRKVKVHER